MPKLTVVLNNVVDLDLESAVSPLTITKYVKSALVRAYTATYTGTANQATRDSIAAALRDLGATEVQWSEGTLVELQQVLIKQCKDHREQKLENRTTFEWPATTGKFFGVGQNSKTNWTGLAVLVTRGVVTLPYTVTTQDETATHDIANDADLDGMLGAAMSAIETERALAATAISNTLGAGSLAAAQSAADVYLVT